MNLFEQLTIADATMTILRYLSVSPLACEVGSVKQTMTASELQDLSDALIRKSTMEEITLKIPYQRLDEHAKRLLAQMVDCVSTAEAEDFDLVKNAIVAYNHKRQIFPKLPAASDEFSDVVKRYALFHNFLKDILVCNTGRMGENQIDAINQCFEDPNTPIVFVFYTLFTTVFDDTQRAIFARQEPFTIILSTIRLMQLLTNSELHQMKLIWTEMQQAIDARQPDRASDMLAFHRLYKSVLKQNARDFFMQDRNFHDYAQFIRFEALGNLTEQQLAHCYVIFYQFQDLSRGDQPFEPDQLAYSVFVYLLQENNTQAIKAFGQVYGGEFAHWVDLLDSSHGVLVGKHAVCLEALAMYAKDSISKQEIFNRIVRVGDALTAEQRHSLETYFPQCNLPSNLPENAVPTYRTASRIRKKTTFFVVEASEANTLPGLSTVTTKTANSDAQPERAPKKRRQIPTTVAKKPEADLELEPTVSVDNATSQVDVNRRLRSRERRQTQFYVADAQSTNIQTSSTRSKSPNRLIEEDDDDFPIIIFNSSSKQEPSKPIPSSSQSILDATIEALIEKQPMKDPARRKRESEGPVVTSVDNSNAVLGTQEREITIDPKRRFLKKFSEEVFVPQEAAADFANADTHAPGSSQPALNLANTVSYVFNPGILFAQEKVDVLAEEDKSDNDEENSTEQSYIRPRK